MVTASQLDSLPCSPYAGLHIRAWKDVRTWAQRGGSFSLLALGLLTAFLHKGLMLKAWKAWAFIKSPRHYPVRNFLAKITSVICDSFSCSCLSRTWRILTCPFFFTVTCPFEMSLCLESLNFQKWPTILILTDILPICLDLEQTASDFSMFTSLGSPRSPQPVKIWTSFFFPRVLCSNLFGRCFLRGKTP